MEVQWSVRSSWVHSTAWSHDVGAPRVLHGVVEQPLLIQIGKGLIEELLGRGDSCISACVVGIAGVFHAVGLVVLDDSPLMVEGRGRSSVKGGAHSVRIQGHEVVSI